MKKSAKFHSLVFSLLIPISAFGGGDIPSMKLSKETENYLEDAIKTCASFSPSAYDSFNKHYRCFKDTLKYSYERYCTVMFHQSITDMGCDKNVVSTFKKMVNKDILPRHKYALLEIKKEIKKFKEKGLDGTAAIYSYDNYLEDNQIEDLIPADPEITQYKKDVAEAIEKRRATCTNVENLKDPLSTQKPRDQDSIGWCYAYVASDLLSHALGKEVSASHLANLNNDSFFNKLFNVNENGYVDDTVELALKNGVCLEKDMPSADYSYSVNSLSVGEAYSKIIEYGKDYSMMSENGKAKTETRLCSPAKRAEFGFSNYFPNISPKELVEILRKTESNLFRELALKCPLDRDPLLKKLKVKTVKGKNIFSVMDEQLTKGNILGISYSAHTLNDYTRGEDGFHASSIIGRRFNEKTKTCEYQLRNSRGNSCSMTDPRYECKNGHYWIGEEYLKYSNTIKIMDYIEKK